MLVKIDRVINCDGNIFRTGDIVKIDFKRDGITDTQVGKIVKIYKDDVTFCVDCSTNFHSSVYDVCITNVVSMSLYENKDK